MLALGFPAAGQTADSYGELLDKQLGVPPEPSSDGRLDRDKMAKMTAEEWRVYELEAAIKAEAKRIAEGTAKGPLVAEPANQAGMVMTVVVPVVVVPMAGFCLLVICGFLLKRRLDAMAAASILTEERTAALADEDPSMATFFLELRALLNPEATNEAPSAQAAPATPEVQPGSLEKFFAAAPDQLAGFHKLVAGINEAGDEVARRNILLEFSHQMQQFKELTSLQPELRLARLMACAVEGLLKQLRYNVSELTDSALGTVSGALDLLESLCVPGLNPHLAVQPPVELLAVDDDAVSRLAISFALKKAFHAPDLANDGEGALALEIGRAHV